MRLFFFTTGIILPIVFALLVLVSPVNAESVSEGTFAGSHTNFELSDDTITGKSKFEAELELRYRIGDLSSFIRLSNDRPFAFQVEPVTATKLGIDYKFSDDLRAYAGDYSLVFGRGTALNAIEERAVDRDSQLRGGMVKGGIKDVELTAFWGTHKSRKADYFVSGVNTDNNGPADMLKGARLDYDGHNFSTGFGYVDANTQRINNPLSTAITEFNVSLNEGDFSAYYEGAWFNRNEIEGAEKSNDGSGHYAEIQYGAGGISLSGSWVRYKKADFEYGTAPSLKRPDIENSAAHPQDQTGYRFDSSFSPPSWKDNNVRVLYTNLTRIKGDDENFKNIFVEWATPSTEEWSGIISYDRISGFLLYYGAINGTDESYRLSVDGPFVLGGTFHFQTRYRLLESKFANDDELEFGLDWNITQDFTIGLFHEASTRKIEPPPPGLIGIPTQSPGQWNSAFVKWSPDPDSEVNVLLGSQRGGFQCSGGVCAQLPPFKGISVTYYRSF